MIELSVENLHLTYGDNPVLKGVSMTLGRGEVVSLLGPSGSGFGEVVLQCRHAM